MKIYKIYVYKKSGFEFAEEVDLPSKVNTFVQDAAKDGCFIRVDNFTLYTWGRKAGQQVLIGCKIYLRGEVVASNYEFSPDIIDELKQTLTCMYHVKGKEDYYPDQPMSIADLKKLFGLRDKEWFTTKVVADEPSRMAIVYYDWNQFNCSREKVLNKKASKRFGEELYGDILYINENLIS